LIDWVQIAGYLPAAATILAVAFEESPPEAFAVSLTALLVMAGIVRVHTPIGSGVFLTTIQAVAVAFLLFGAVTIAAAVAIVTVVTVVTIVPTLATVVLIPVVYAVAVAIITIILVAVVYAVPITIIPIIFVTIIYAIAIAVSTDAAIIFVAVIDAISVAIFPSIIPITTVPRPLSLRGRKTGEGGSDHETQSQCKRKCILLKILDCHFSFSLT
jgi:hypothetical protein